MKSINKKKKKNTFIIFIFILSLLTPLLFAYFISRQYLQSVKTRAQEEDDATFCKNHCTPSHGNEPNCRGKPDFYDEECCLRIQQTGDPSECPWPQRGWCMPEHCATIPEGVNRLRCAGPRESWCNMCKERGCFKPSPSPTPIPTPTLVPTKIISQPTQPPPLPTLPPKKLVTPYVFPTTNIPLLPTKEPLLTPTISHPGSGLPEITLPTVNLKKIKQKSNEVIKKPLGFFEWVFIKINYYDRLLEENINQKIEKIFNFRF